MTHVGMFEEAWLNDENKAWKKRIKELEGINKRQQKLNGELQQENKRQKEDVDRVSEERDNFETLEKSKDTQKQGDRDKANARTCSTK